MDGHCDKDAERWGVPPVLKFFDARPMRDLDGMYRATTEPRYGYGQPFWFSSDRYPTAEAAMRSAELYGPRGPSC
jgi:hypothetical protein